MFPNRRFSGTGFVIGGPMVDHFTGIYWVPPPIG
jgi:hypothetical protein